MSRKLTGRDVVCPYFRREDSISISCESWVRGATGKLCFRTGEEKRAYMARRCKCMEGYPRCLVARINERKYELREQEREAREKQKNPQEG